VTVQLPFEQAHPLELSPSLRQLQHEGVIHRVRTPVGDEAWLVTGYEEVRRLLASIHRVNRCSSGRADAKGAL
jgi:pentalenolactone synthase